MDTTVGRSSLNSISSGANAVHQRLLKKKGSANLVHIATPRIRSEDHGRHADKVKNLGFLYCDARRYFDRRRHMVVPSVKKETGEERGDGSHRGRSPVSGRRITHGERYNKIIEIWSRVTEKVSDEMFSAMEEDDRTGRYLNPIYIMADSGARGSKQQIRQLSVCASDGEAVGRNHRNPDHGELREGSERSAVLHLDARRPQGSGRYGAQDGRFRLSDPRLVDVAQGRDHHRNGLRDHGRHHRGTDYRIGRNDRAACATASSDVVSWKISRLRRQPDRPVNQEITENLADRFRHPVSSASRFARVLTCESKPRCLRGLLRRNLATRAPGGTR